VKVTVMLEELLALGHSGAEYDAWLIKIDERPVRQRLRRGQSELQDPGADGPQRADADPGVRVRRDPDAPRRESSAPSCRPAAPARAECLSWLFWQMGSAPYLGGGFGHFYAYAPTKIEYAIDRFAMEVKRQLDVLDRASPTTNISPAATTRSPTWRSGPGTAALAKGLLYGAGEFLSVHEYKNVQRWTDRDRQTPGGEARAHGQPHSGDPASQLARAPRRQRPGGLPPKL
jgi:GST-like protein